MKNRILFSIGLICSFMGMNIQEGMGQCSLCSGTASGTGSIAIGGLATATGSEAVTVGGYAVGSKTVAIGTSASASAVGAVAVGDATASGLGGYSFGSKVFASGDNSFVIGLKATADVTKSYNYIFGCGTEDYNLLNNVDNSIMLGINSNLSTLLVSGASGYNTWGNVGIGNVTAPASLLHVRDQIRVGLTSGANGSLVFNNSASNTITFNTPASMSSQSYTLPTIIGSTGDVLMLDNVVSGQGELLWTSPGAITDAWMLAGNGGTTAGTDYLGTSDGVDLVFKTNATERMRITTGSQGNVGIGTQTPAQKLHVVAKEVSGTERIARFGVEDNLDAFFQIWNKSAVDDQFAPSFYGISSTEADEGLDFRATLLDTLLDTLLAPVMSFTSRFYNIGGTIQTRPLFQWKNNTSPVMHMSANGNLGIGTITPKNRLDVEGSLAVGASYSGTTTAPTNGAIIQGNVGIGTNAPGYKLDVQGTAGATVNINTNGNVQGNAFIATSDQMFKSNIDTIENALLLIDQLKPRTYYYDTLNFNGEGKFNFETNKQFGFIAQQVEEILPDIVKTAVKPAIIDSLGNIVLQSYTYKALNYSAIIPILTKGMQELKIDNDSLRSQLSEAMATNAQFQEQINQFTYNDAIQTAQIEQLIARVDMCCSNPQGSYRLENNEDNIEVYKNQAVNLTDARSIVLDQNVPNPFAEQTTIYYSIPSDANRAQLLFYNSSGKLIQSVELIEKGSGMLNVFAQDLSNGIYTYSLVVDGQVIATKRMVKAK